LVLVRLYLCERENAFSDRDDQSQFLVDNTTARHAA
jgi:hypothetical protein